MSKKITKIIAIIFAVLAAVSLTFPIYETTFTDGESMTLLLRGYDLYEFSAWGVLAILLPLLIVCIMFSKFNDRIKSALILGTFVLGSISVQISNTAMRDWIYGEATGTVQHFGGLVTYVSFYFCAFVFCFIYCLRKTYSKFPSIEDFRDYLYSEKIILDSKSIFEKDYLLYNKPCKIIRNDKRATIKEVNANVLFATPDRYFITNESDDYNNDEIEVEGETVGFAYKNTDILGLVNVFYPDAELTSCEKIKVMPESEISSGEAELYYNGKRTKINLSVKEDKVFGISATLCEDNYDIGEICGGVILQNGKLAAVATYYDEKRKVIICENAEKHARKLSKAIYEQELFEIACGFKDFWCKNKNKKRDYILYSEY